MTIHTVKHLSLRILPTVFSYVAPPDTSEQAKAYRFNSWIQAT
jgi:hypothetical protein